VDALPRYLVLISNGLKTLAIDDSLGYLYVALDFM
jgi:hypothetical protein